MAAHRVLVTRAEREGRLSDQALTMPAAMPASELGCVDGSGVLIPVGAHPACWLTCKHASVAPSEA